MGSDGETGPQRRKAELYASLSPAAWYVACVDSEDQARRGLQERGVETWLPECRIVVSRRRKRAIIDGPLFPGYVFVRGVLTDEWLSLVLKTRGVDDVIRMHSRPLAACEAQMILLQRLVAESGGRVLIEGGRVKRGFGEPEPLFRAGQLLRVLDGPFTSFNGVYQEPAGEERLQLLLDIFGRATVVTLSEASVEAVA